MGLDMYAQTAPRSAVTKPTDFDLRNVEGLEDLHYWRKHPNLHGFMEALYRLKGGEREDFNCDTLELTERDLNVLEAIIREDMLPPTTGFFFGESDGSEKEDDLAFVAKARAALKEGKAVVYHAWW